MGGCRFGCSSSEEDEDGLVRHSHLSFKAGACAEGPSKLRRLSSVPIYLILAVKDEKQLDHVVRGKALEFRSSGTTGTVMADTIAVACKRLLNRNELWAEFELLAQ